MAGIRATVNVNANIAPAKRSLERATNELNKIINGKLGNKKVDFNVNSKSFTQPLGRITASANEFTKSLEASNARVIAFGASVGIINGITDSFKFLIAETVRFEKTLVDINAVLNSSNQQLEKFGQGLFDVAQNTAQSFNLAADAALEFSRQGLSVEEVLRRTNDALLLTRITSLDAAEAVAGLTAAVNAFGQAGLTTTDIVDKLAAVDVKFAVSSEDLINGLERAGAVAIDAGVSLDSLIGIITSLQQTTARGGAVIGNGLKTIFTRIQRPESIRQLEDMGIAVKSLTGAILPADQILKNIAKNFDALSQSQQSNIVQFSAGIFQANIFRAALTDLSKAQGIQQQATEISGTAAGEAARKNEILNKSISALAAQAGTGLRELVGIIGELGVKPEIGSFLEFFGERIEDVKRSLGGGEDAGSTFAKGIVRGIGNILTGPGLIAFSAIFTKLLFNVFKFASSSLKDVLGIVSQKEKIKQIEQSIVQVLGSNLDVTQALNNLEGDRVAQEKLILGLIEQQTSAMVQQQRLAAQLAKPLLRQGVSPDLSSMQGVGGGGGSFSFQGVLPEESKVEKAGAMKAGYTAGPVAATNIEGIGRVIYNKAETIKTFSGMKQPAIMPPKESKAGKNYKSAFAKKHGFDPYASKGFVPNYNEFLTNDVASGGAKMFLKGTPFNRFPAYINKQINEEMGAEGSVITFNTKAKQLKTSTFHNIGEYLEGLGVNQVETKVPFSFIDLPVNKKGRLSNDAKRNLTSGTNDQRGDYASQKFMESSEGAGYRLTDVERNAVMDAVKAGSPPSEHKAGEIELQNIFEKSIRRYSNKAFREQLFGLANKYLGSAKKNNKVKGLSTDGEIAESLINSTKKLEEDSIIKNLSTLARMGEYTLDGMTHEETVSQVINKNFRRKIQKQGIGEKEYSVLERFGLSKGFVPNYADRDTVYNNDKKTISGKNQYLLKNGKIFHPNKGQAIQSGGEVLGTLINEGKIEKENHILPVNDLLDPSTKLQKGFPLKNKIKGADFQASVGIKAYYGDKGGATSAFDWSNKKTIGDKKYEEKGLYDPESKINKSHTIKQSLYADAATSGKAHNLSKMLEKASNTSEVENSLRFSTDEGNILHVAFPDNVVEFIKGRGTDGYEFISGGSRGKINLSKNRTAHVHDIVNLGKEKLGLEKRSIQFVQGEIFRDYVNAGKGYVPNFSYRMMKDILGRGKKPLANYGAGYEEGTNGKLIGETLKNKKKFLTEHGFKNFSKYMSDQGKPVIGIRQGTLGPRNAYWINSPETLRQVEDWGKMSNLEITSLTGNKTKEAEEQIEKQKNELKFGKFESTLSDGSMRFDSNLQSVNYSTELRKKLTSKLGKDYRYIEYNKQMIEKFARDNDVTSLQKFSGGDYKRIDAKKAVEDIINLPASKINELGAFRPRKPNNLELDFINETRSNKQIKWKVQDDSSSKSGKSFSLQASNPGAFKSFQSFLKEKGVPLRNIENIQKKINERYQKFQELDKPFRTMGPGGRQSKRMAAARGISNMAKEGTVINTDGLYIKNLGGLVKEYNQRVQQMTEEELIPNFASTTLYRGTSPKYQKAVKDIPNPPQFLFDEIMAANTKSDFITAVKKLGISHSMGAYSGSYNDGVYPATIEQIRGYEEMDENQILQGGYVYPRPLKGGFGKQDGVDITPRHQPSGFVSRTEDKDVARSFAKSSLPGYEYDPNEMGNVEEVSVPNKRIFDQTKLEKYIDRFGVENVKKSFKEGMRKGTLKDVYLNLHKFRPKVQSTDPLDMFSPNAGESERSIGMTDGSMTSDEREITHIWSKRSPYFGNKGLIPNFNVNLSNGYHDKRSIKSAIGKVYKSKTQQPMPRQDLDFAVERYISAIKEKQKDDSDGFASSYPGGHFTVKGQKFNFNEISMALMKHGQFYEDPRENSIPNFAQKIRNGSIYHSKINNKAVRVTRANQAEQIAYIKHHEQDHLFDPEVPFSDLTPATKEQVKKYLSKKKSSGFIPNFAFEDDMQNRDKENKRREVEAQMFGTEKQRIERLQNANQANRNKALDGYDPKLFDREYPHPFLGSSRKNMISRDFGSTRNVEQAIKRHQSKGLMSSSEVKKYIEMVQDGSQLKDLDEKYLNEYSKNSETYKLRKFSKQRDELDTAIKKEDYTTASQVTNSAEFKKNKQIYNKHANYLQSTRYLDLDVSAARKARDRFGQNPHSSLMNDPEQLGYFPGIKKSYGVKGEQPFEFYTYSSSNYAKSGPKIRSSGLIPSFYNPLSDAIQREKAAGIPQSKIRVEKSSQLKSAANPMGLAVTNTRDEPGGLQQGIRRAKRQGIDPKKHGMAKGLIPNFADQPITPENPFDKIKESLKDITKLGTAGNLNHIKKEFEEVDKLLSGIEFKQGEDISEDIGKFKDSLKKLNPILEDQKTKLDKLPKAGKGTRTQEKERQKTETRVEKLEGIKSLIGEGVEYEFEGLLEKIREANKEADSISKKVSTQDEFKEVKKQRKALREEVGLSSEGGGFDASPNAETRQADQGALQKLFFLQSALSMANGFLEEFASQGRGAMAALSELGLSASAVTSAYIAQKELIPEVMEGLSGLTGVEAQDGIKIGDLFKGSSQDGGGIRNNLRGIVDEARNRTAEIDSGGPGGSSGILGRLGRFGRVFGTITRIGTRFLPVFGQLYTGFTAVNELVKQFGHFILPLEKGEGIMDLLSSESEKAAKNIEKLSASTEALQSALESLTKQSEIREKIEDLEVKGSSRSQKQETELYQLKMKELDMSISVEKAMSKLYDENVVGSEIASNLSTKFMDVNSNTEDQIKTIQKLIGVQKQQIAIQEGQKLFDDFIEDRLDKITLNKNDTKLLQESSKMRGAQLGSAFSNNLTGDIGKDITSLSNNIKVLENLAQFSSGKGGKFSESRIDSNLEKFIGTEEFGGSLMADRVMSLVKSISNAEDNMAGLTGNEQAAIKGAFSVIANQLKKRKEQLEIESGEGDTIAESNVRLRNEYKQLLAAIKEQRLDKLHQNSLGLKELKLDNEILSAKEKILKENILLSNQAAIENDFARKRNELQQDTLNKREKADIDALNALKKQTDFVMNKDNFAASIRNAEVAGLNTGVASVSKLSSLLSGNEASVEGLKIAAQDGGIDIDRLNVDEELIETVNKYFKDYAEEIQGSVDIQEASNKILENFNNISDTRTAIAVTLMMGEKDIVNLNQEQLTAINSQLNAYTRGLDIIEQDNKAAEEKLKLQEVQGMIAGKTVKGATELLGLYYQSKKSQQAVLDNINGEIFTLRASNIINKNRLSLLLNARSLDEKAFENQTQKNRQDAESAVLSLRQLEYQNATLSKQDEYQIILEAKNKTEIENAKLALKESRFKNKFLNTSNNLDILAKNQVKTEIKNEEISKKINLAKLNHLIEADELSQLSENKLKSESYSAIQSALIAKEQSDILQKTIGLREATENAKKLQELINKKNEAINLQTNLRDEDGSFAQEAEIDLAIERGNKILSNKLLNERVSQLTDQEELSNQVKMLVYEETLSVGETSLINAQKALQLSENKKQSDLLFKANQLQESSNKLTEMENALRQANMSSAYFNNEARADVSNERLGQISQLRSSASRANFTQDPEDVLAFAQNLEAVNKELGKGSEGLDRVRVKLAEMSVAASNLKSDLVDSGIEHLRTNMVQMFKDIGSGSKSVGDAFKDLGLGLAQVIMDRIMQHNVDKIISDLTYAFTGEDPASDAEKISQSNNFLSEDLKGIGGEIKKYSDALANDKNNFNQSLKNSTDNIRQGLNDMGNNFANKLDGPIETLGKEINKLATEIQKFITKERGELGGKEIKEQLKDRTSVKELIRQTKDFDNIAERNAGINKKITEKELEIQKIRNKIPSTEKKLKDAQGTHSINQGDVKQAELKLEKLKKDGPKDGYIDTKELNRKDALRAIIYGSGQFDDTQNLKGQELIKAIEKNARISNTPQEIVSQEKAKSEAFKERQYIESRDDKLFFVDKDRKPKSGSKPSPFVGGVEINQDFIKRNREKFHKDEGFEKQFSDESRRQHEDAINQSVQNLEKLKNRAQGSAQELNKLEANAERFNNRIDSLNSSIDRLNTKIRTPNVEAPAVDVQTGDNFFGGRIQKFASGGFVEGPPGTDNIPAMLTAGEYVMPKKDVEEAFQGGRIQKFNNGTGSQGAQNNYADQAIRGAQGVIRAAVMTEVSRRIGESILGNKDPNNPPEFNMRKLDRLAIDSDVSLRSGDPRLSGRALAQDPVMDEYKNYLIDKASYEAKLKNEEVSKNLSTLGSYLGMAGSIIVSSMISLAKEPIKKAVDYIKTGGENFVKGTLGFGEKSADYKAINKISEAKGLGKVDYKDVVAASKGNGQITLGAGEFDVDGNSLAEVHNISHRDPSNPYITRNKAFVTENPSKTSVTRLKLTAQKAAYEKKNFLEKTAHFFGYEDFTFGTEGNGSQNSLHPAAKKFAYGGSVEGKSQNNLHPAAVNLAPIEKGSKNEFYPALKKVKPQESGSQNDFHPTAGNFASGGSVKAMLTAGEGFIPAPIAKRIGYSNLDKMNKTGSLPLVQGPSGIDKVGPVSLTEGDFIIRKNSTDKLMRENPNMMRFALQNPDQFRRQADTGYYEGGIVGTGSSGLSVPSVQSNNPSTPGSVSPVNRIKPLIDTPKVQSSEQVTHSENNEITNNISVNVKIDSSGKESVETQAPEDSYAKEQELALKIKSKVLEVIREEKRLGGELE